MNGERVHFERLHDNAEYASQVFLRLCFATGAPAETLKMAGQRVLTAVRKLRDSGEEW